MAYATRHLAFLAELRHDWDSAEALYRRSLTLRERFGPGPGVAAAIVALAELRYARGGDTREAIRELARARAIAADTGSAAYVAIAGAAIARVQRDANQLDAALATLAAALAAADAIHSDEDVPEMYEQRALIDLLAERPSAAVVDVDRAIARRSSPRLVALRALALARAGGATAGASEPADDPVVRARRALATGQPAPALEAALAGDDPDTLLLAARAVGGDALDRAARAAEAIAPAQGVRFARERRGR
jgi:tetratricopeptide (TPR) repeat protein